MLKTFVSVIVLTLVLEASFSMPISRDLETVQFSRSLSESDVTLQLSNSLSESDVTVQLSKSSRESDVTVQLLKSLNGSDVTERASALFTETVYSLDDEIKPVPSFSTETVLEAFTVSFEEDHIKRIKREVFTGGQTLCPEDMFKSFGRCLTKKEYHEIEEIKPVPNLRTETALEAFAVGFEADHVKRIKREMAKGGPKLCPSDMKEIGGRCFTPKQYDEIEEIKPVPSFRTATALEAFTVGFEADHVKRIKREMAKGGPKLCPSDMKEIGGRCFTPKQYDEITGDDCEAES